MTCPAPFAAVKRVVALLLLGHALASAAGAAPPTPPGRSVYKPSLVLQWKSRLQVANASLKAGDWKKGRDIADSVLREMRDRIASGDASGDLLAVAFMFRSIGEAGMGEIESASWDFGFAQTLYPAYGKVDLEPYGAAGTLLSQQRYVDGAPPDPPRNQVDASVGTVNPPRKVSGPTPEYPLAKAASCIEQKIVVRAFIDAQGRPEKPSLPPGTDPVLGVAALDAVRMWRFEPATQDGKPVRVILELTVNFHVRGC
jgi:TonB family protein